MDQNRKRDEDMPNRSSNMEQAEGSREDARNSGDLGSSSDRAMFSERMNESDRTSSRDRSNAMQSERGMGSGDERPSSKSGGISNRSLDREQCEQDRLPERGRSQSER